MIHDIVGLLGAAWDYPQFVKWPERTLTAFPPGDRKLATHQPDVHKKRQGKLIPILFAFRFCIFNFSFLIRARSERDITRVSGTLTPSSILGGRTSL